MNCKYKLHDDGEWLPGRILTWTVSGGSPGGLFQITPAAVVVSRDKSADLEPRAVPLPQLRIVP